MLGKLNECRTEERPQRLHERPGVAVSETSTLINIQSNIEHQHCDGVAARHEALVVITH